MLGTNMKAASCTGARTKASERSVRGFYWRTQQTGNCGTEDEVHTHVERILKTALLCCVSNRGRKGAKAPEYRFREKADDLGDFVVVDPPIEVKLQRLKEPT